MIGLRCKFTMPQQTNVNICMFFFYNKLSVVSVLFKLTFCPACALMGFRFKTFLNAAYQCAQFFFQVFSLMIILKGFSEIGGKLRIWVAKIPPN